MTEGNKNQPFAPLGTQLRHLREKRQETLAEASGAVEIEPDALNAIEEGAERPGEDILLLLISHFAAKEDVATKLWELAGFDQDGLPTQNVVNNSLGGAQNGVMVMPGETPIIYTDMVHVMVNNYGVVMNFMQTSGTSNQPIAVSRIGMSREHAQSVLEVLQKTLSLQNNTLPAKRSNHTNEKPEK